MDEILRLGDCLSVLKDLPDNSVDAVITDPPYGLSFMGKKWDYDVPSREIWEECLRVLKPGGYLLAFAGTRTQHRMAVRIEDAGFEIRDMIAWVYGSGFPKSLNIGKAVDKLQGNEREDLGSIKKLQSYGHEGNNCFGNDIDREGKMIITKGTSEWEGWGTALKPALEPITVARKPLSEKTVAENCLKWGTGGINIDGCRVSIDEKADASQLRTMNRSFKEEKNGWGMNQNSSDTPQVVNPQGRFPANLIHDGSDEVVELFPNSKSSDAIRKNNNSKTTGINTFGKYQDIETNGYNDSGSASRFFYCAKASKSERNKGCEELEDKNKVFNGQSDNSSKEMKGIEQKFTTQPSKNNHPTVKPIALMEYLVKLVSREGAVVLDPFMGSGSTGIACKNLNRYFIGVEREEEYVKIAKKRLGL